MTNSKLADAKNLAERLHAVADDRHPAEHGYAYFMGGDGGSIKIGYSREPVNRLRCISIEHKRPGLRLLAIREGGCARERAYHQQFRTHLIGHEWFHPHQDILDEIKRLHPVTLEWVRYRANSAHYLAQVAEENLRAADALLAQFEEIAA